MGEKAINAWLCFVAVAMNLLVMKQITLFGLNVTATDSLAVSYMLGLNMIQEVYGTNAARQHAFLAIFVCAGFTILTVLHNFYIPNSFDCTHGAYKLILSSMPRIVIASMLSFLAIQLLDIVFFNWLREKFNGKYFSGRVTYNLIVSQTLDTLLFSYLGLYGLVPNLWHIIWLSLGIKMIVIVFSVPFAQMVKRIFPQERPVLKFYYNG